MMRSMKMIWTGGVLVFVGWIVIFAIVLGHLPSSYVLNFGAYGASFLGLLLGLFGILDHIRPQRD